ncbi:hypothetical protein [Streptomyces sp. NPDC002559]
MMEKSVAAGADTDADAGARAFREGLGHSTTGACGTESGARRGIVGGAGKGS